jgi:hypothetical protein
MNTNRLMENLKRMETLSSGDIFDRSVCLDNLSFMLILFEMVFNERHATNKWCIHAIIHIFYNLSDPSYRNVCMAIFESDAKIVFSSYLRLSTKASPDSMEGLSREYVRQILDTLSKPLS